ncbi:MAG: alpha-D-ribose 1-methylphosphonate 5-triphosphate diphosphatase [Pseudomonadota bacterium]
MIELDLTGAEVLGPNGFAPGRLSFANGKIQSGPVGRARNLAGYRVLPGIVDMHGDGFERHVAPRRGAMTQMGEGIRAAEAELASQGITTAVLAQFVSWEGGLRGLEFAERVFAAIRDTRDMLVTDLRAQLRLETHLTDLFAEMPARIAAWQVKYVVFNDHLPHDRLAAARKPPRLVGQALKAGRNPDAHFKHLLELHGRHASVPRAIEELCTKLKAQGIRLGSHDDSTADERAFWNARGVHIAEFPETEAAASAARAQGDAVVLGAPNLVRGGSHKGNVSVRDLVVAGLCDALTSDYHYPSPRRAALLLAQEGILDLAEAWKLVSSGPARVLGLDDRGTLAPGLRADMVILDAETNHVAATISGGRFSFLAGDIAHRLLSA